MMVMMIVTVMVVMLWYSCDYDVHGVGLVMLMEMVMM